MRICINVKVFELTILLSSAMNMVTQIIYLGRMEVGDWYYAVFFKKYIPNRVYGGLDLGIFSSAVPSGSGAFQMPTRPLAASAASSTLRGEGPISERFSNFFSYFCMKLLWDDINNLS